MSLRGLDPTRFDHDAAHRLAADFDATAAVLDEQSGQRPGLAADPRATWRGQLAQQFDQRTEQTVTDGQRLADAMRRAATALRELSVLAQQEDARRAHARDHLQQQEDLRWWQQAGRNVKDFFTGRDPIPPAPAQQAPRLEVVEVQDPAARC